jgi:uncharacterized membrane protein
VAELIGLAFALILLLITLLPVLTFLRLARVSRDLEELAARLLRLEQAMASRHAAPASSLSATSDLAAASPERACVPEDLSAPPATIPIPSIDEAPVTDAVPPAMEAPAPIPGGVTAASAAPDLETRIGGRGLLYTGVLVLLLGVSFFLKYAFDNDWVTETGRIVIGLLAGGALIAGGLRLARRELVVFGQALAGTGFAVLYLVLYAALNYYALVSPGAAFLAMGLVTLGASLAADRVVSQPLAFIGVGGGFLTPFLVGGDAPNPYTLLVYDLVLVLGTMALARRHRWLALNGLSYLLTMLTVLVWSLTEYSRDRWLTTVLFLTAFVVLFLVILRETLRTPGLLARLVAALLATAPVAYHVAVTVITAAHAPAIHIYLIAFTAAGLWRTADPHRPWVRLFVLLGSFIPLFGSLTLPDGLSWLVPNLVTIVAVSALHTIAVLDRVVRQGERLTTPDLVALHLSGLGLFGLLYEALQPTYPNLRGGLAAVIAAGAGGLWWWLRSRDEVTALHAAGLAFTLVAIGLAVQFDGPAVTIGWAAEGAAVTWVGLRNANQTFQFGGLVLWVLAVLRLSENYFDTPASFIALLNARALTSAFIIVMGYALASLFRRSHAANATLVRTSLHVVCSVVSLMWITGEIDSYWDLRGDQAQAYLYREMMMSLGWGLYGAGAIVVGMRRRYAPMRYIGMAVLVITVLKVFFYDLWELGGIYRVIGFLAFGVLLVLVSYLYQRRRTSTEGGDARPPLEPRPEEDRPS